MLPREYQNNANRLSEHDSTDEVQRQIDQEIQKLEDQIRDLKSQRNTRAPISRLPPETLAIIFTLTISDPLAPDALDWIKVSYVSRHWRQVALEYPGLWGNLVLAQPEWCKEMLKRSKTASLTVKANLDSTNLKPAKVFKLVMLQGHRIQELQLHCTSNSLTKKLLYTNPPLQVPIIRSLSISIIPCHYYHLSELLTLTQSMLSGETPYLRHLDLRHCNVTWDVPLFNTLTSLTIHNAQESFKPTIRQLTNTFKRMPALEVLVLDNVIPLLTPGTPPLPTEDSVNLAELTDLVITSTVTGYIGLTSLIKIPRTTRVDFCCAADDFSGLTGKNLRPANTSNSAKDIEGLTTKSIIRTLNIQIDSANVLVFDGWNASHSSAILPKPDVRLRLPLKSHISSYQMQYIITDACSSMDLQHLCRLSVALGSETVTTKTWMDIFGTQAHLHSIHVEMKATHPLLAALHSLQPTNQKRSEAQSLYFPHLRYLTIRACHFEDEYSAPGIMPLRNCMEYRSRHGARLRELRLCECRYFHDGDMDSLKKVVNVYWDGIVLEDEYNVDDE